MEHINTGPVNSESIYTIINPVAAGGKAVRRWPEDEKQLRSEGLDLHCFFTQFPGQATLMVREALEAGYERIMAVGGDGTVNEVVNGFFVNGKYINPAASLIVFSRGTGSDYIKSLRIGNSVKDIINIAQNGNKDYFDLGQITYINHQGHQEKRFFVNLADAGIGGETVYFLERASNKGRGLLTYLYGIIRSISKYDNKRFQLTVDGREVLNSTINSVMVANGEYFAGGMKIAPGASPVDGEFNIVILRDITKIETLINLYRAYRGNHLSHPRVEMIKGREITIKAEGRVLLDVDGESVGRLPAEFKILENRLPVQIYPSHN